MRNGPLGAARARLRPLGPCLAATVAVLFGACRGPAPTADRLLEDLPILEFPAASGAPLAVFLSGDGGWADLPREVGRRLGAAGVSVVGLDSRRYLERARTAREVQRDLARILTTYGSAWAPERVVVVGFSRGANLAAFGMAELPDGLGASVTGVVLLAPGTHEKFRFRPWDLLRSTADPDGTPLAPVVRAIPPLPVRCVNGRDERVRVCEGLTDAPGVHVLVRPGGHHLDRDYDGLADLVLEVLDADAARPTP